MTSVALNRVQEKALRLVDEQRVHVTWVEATGIAGAGIVDGYHDIYHCAFTPAGRVCTCPAGRTHRDCSHALALEWKVWSTGRDDLQLELELL